MIRLPSLLIATIVLVAALYSSKIGATDAKKSANAPPDCNSFLTGNWAGDGTVTGFGPPIQVASTASYRSDGTFTSTTRYLGRDKTWTEQTTTGNWSVTPTPSSKICSLTLNSVTENMKASTTSEFTIIDADTFNAFGLDIKRIR